MINKGLCFTGCIMHFFLAGTLLVWVAMFRNCNIPCKQWILMGDVLFSICCVFIGKVIMKLNIDKLFAKIETGGTSMSNKVFFIIVLIVALLIVSFEVLMVFVYFFRGIKMKPDEFVRFTILPTLSLAHLMLGSGSYLALSYFSISL